PAVGVAAPVTALMVDQGRVRPGSLARVNDPARDAAQRFRKLLKANGVKVTSLKAGVAPANGTKIASVESPPMATLVERMLTDSDNDLAEALAHLAGGAAGYQASFAGGAKATRKVLADLGLPVDGLRLADGSGVSADNRMSAAVLARLLGLVATGSKPELGPIASGLAVAGFSGTLADRVTGPDRAAAGYVRAKTGTLTGVTSLAGLVPDTSGRMLAFALLANDIPSIPKARALGDEFAAGLAACGCG
ncbi:MAG: D-alanyl-D-alanine carboxypeptidase/D-alanyl-D-alanine-endopeptidase, partial [Actinomycetales bacterium]